MSKNKVQDPFVGPIKEMQNRLGEHQSNYFRGRHRVVMLDTRESILALTNTSDTGWTDIDVSSLMPVTISADTVALIILAEIRDTGSGATDCSVSFRKNGTTSTVLVANGSHINDVYGRAQGIVAIDSNDILEYIVDATGANTADVNAYIVGYIEQLS